MCVCVWGGCLAGLTCWGCPLETPPLQLPHSHHLKLGFSGHPTWDELSRTMPTLNHGSGTGGEAETQSNGGMEGAVGMAGQN